MKIKHYILMLTVMALPMNAMAQKLCDFETQDYDSLNVFDQWAGSPFTQKILNGNVAVIPNTIMGPSDSTANILAFQRSRYASNIFGAKIRLKVPFELTTTTKYVHVLINKPIEGRVMLVGLGKRSDRPGQSDQVVQFNSTSNSKINLNEWTDAVFAIKGNGGILISSLVVVPHSESAHDLTADFMTYIDDIEINNSPVPRYRTEDYYLNVDANTSHSRTDRSLNAVKFTGNMGGKLSATAPTTGSKYIYRQMTDSVGFAVPGEIITPTINYVGTWMHGYVYLDFMNDGKFDLSLNANGTPAAGSDVVSYSYYSDKNSKGVTPSNQNPGWNPPTFTIPSAMQPGIYRMRYKVDWDNIDAGGNMNAGNTITANGGGIIDVLLNIHKSTSHVQITTRNGDVMHGDNTAFIETDVPFGKTIDVILKPEVGFKQNGIVIKHGYLGNNEFVHGNRQWRIDTIPASQFVDNKFTIPAKYVDGDIEIVAEFAESTSGLQLKSENSNLTLRTSSQTLSVVVTKPTEINIFDVMGKSIFSGCISEKRSFKLNSGIYFANNQKVVVP